MDNLFDQGNIIALTAKEVLSLEKQSLEFDRRSAQLKEKAEQSRSILFDLISELQNTLPDKPLPGLFTVNGMLIDITGAKGYIELHRAPELNHLLELTSDTSG